MSTRKRINLSVPEATFLELQAIAKRAGAKGVCALLVALTDHFVQYVKSRKNATTKPQAIGQEINEMFNRLEGGEIEIKKNSRNCQQRITRI